MGTSRCAVGLMAFAGILPVSNLAGQSRVAQSPEGCRVEEISRTRLEVGERTLAYIEAGAFVANGSGDVLLAGSRSFLTRFDTSGVVVAVTEDSVFGAIVPRRGRARPVPLPIPGSKVQSIRVLSRSGRGWEAVFAQMQPVTDSTKRAPIAGLWYGTYDGTKWASLERLPLPAEGTVSPLFGSSLVRNRDTLSWAMRLSPPKNQAQIIVFQRIGGRWFSEIVPTFHSQVELTHSYKFGLLMLVVQPDSTLRSDGNSLFLWARTPTWRKVRRLVHGAGEGRVYNPSAMLSGETGAFSWESPVRDDKGVRNELRAMVGRVVDRNEPVVSLDSFVAGFRSSSGPIGIRSVGSPIWVSGRSPSPGGSLAIRFTTSSDGSSVQLGSIPSPYSGYMAAAAVGERELLITGLEYVPMKYLVSLLIRTRVECSHSRIKSYSRAKAHLFH